MAEVVPARPADNLGLSAGHVPRCVEYRRAYRERNKSLTARVCCCAESVESPLPHLETQEKVTMGDMPCIWCLLFVGEQYYGPDHVFAENPAMPEQTFPVRSWADAEDAKRDGLVVRDHNKVRCGLNADTLVSGDAVCRGHAAVVLHQRMG